MRKQWQSRVPFVVLLLSAGVATAQQNSEEDDLALSYGSKAVVSIATGSQQTISRAPAVASVITAEDIRAMGATQLDQVLESVPGLHVSFSGLYNDPIYSFRGITSKYNSDTLMLVNGISINTAFLGNQGLAWGGMPLENIARIEIIRGPGSALYGADAFAGVINIITKTSADINGTEYGLRAGSQDTHDAWFLHGGKMGPVDVAFYLAAGHTGGSTKTVDADTQTGLDKIFGTHASLAPGPENMMRNTLDMNVDLSYGLWRLRAGYQDREMGTGVGLAEALDPQGRVRGRRWNTDLSYANPAFSRNWDVTAQVSLRDVKDLQADPNTVLFPPGAFGGAFPNGVIGNPGHAERDSQFSLSGFYTGFDRHRIRLGAGYNIEDMYETNEKKNFQIVDIPGVGPSFVPLGSVVDVSGTSFVFLTPHKRTVAYVFAQDEWTLAKDWILTAGVRTDRYSDFGSTTNPRVALVWDVAYNFSVKALYGSAFRAPSFTEQYSMNNPVTIGNPNLKPETINTRELAFAWQPTQSLQTNLSLYYYRMHNLIEFVPNADPSTGSTAQNTGDQTGRGLELEAIWDATRSLRLSGNYSLQHSVDQRSGQDAGLAPHQRLFARADWRLAPLWRLGTTINHVADRKRQPGDTRPPIADYTTVDLNLRKEKLIGNWSVTAMVLNLFNRDAKDPSFAPGNIPFDLPLPGRTFYVQFQHKL
ncbi:TonB-dependent receptor [Collimonas arenae]|uniref:TonB-dependent receptor n=1 Tax=Collimonas arenae TaxID=279058 RepID=A0A0A1FHD8_9BURK|nr:TonB-dependent receptor [Collimonas arenae]AIY42262.1 TonB-dependent receptor [Collimonas arenae]